MSEKEPVEATWFVSIYADCPHCGEWRIDITDGEDFWCDGDGVDLKLAEEREGTAVCPECSEEFKYKMVW